ncbi:MAG: hypothetical protein QF454_05250 [Candidatus Thalassarchaeaceae archaeon]|nr:hypothetical protein [Candidatus Thalassarchaeaceae archaeon]
MAEEWELEDHLLECLEVAIKAGDLPEKRRNKAMKTAAWELLNKPYKGILMVALDKEEVSGEAGSGRSNSRRRRSRGLRKRRTSTEDWIESVESLITSIAPPGYRLASMLIKRARLGDKWNPKWDYVLTELREKCKSGVHPVWAIMGREAPLLAELTAYPELKIKDEDWPIVSLENSSEWVEGSRLDPLNHDEVGKWLSLNTPFPLSAEQKLALQHLSSDFGRRSAPKLPKSLTKFEGEATLIPALIKLAIGDESGCTDLEALSKGDGDIATIATDQLALAQLRSGNQESWGSCQGAKGDDGLSTAMRLQALINAPDEFVLSVDDIDAALKQTLDGATETTLRWKLISTLIQNGDEARAVQETAGLNVLERQHIPLLLEIINRTNASDIKMRIVNQISKYEHEDLVQILSSDSPGDLRVAAVNELQIRGGGIWEESLPTALDLFTELGEATQIGSILMKMQDAGKIHPHRTILVYHLLPAHADSELRNWLKIARPEAIAALSQDSTGILSEASIGLIKLLEGVSADLAPIQKELSREAIKAFNQCRQALMDGGSGLVAEKLLDTLQDSMDSSSISGVEEHLFRAVIANLRFNGTLKLLEDGDERNTTKAEETLELLIQDSPSMQIVNNVRQVVLEHGVAVPALAEWHRLHAPSSASHLVVMASIDETRDNRLAAARGLRRACRDSSIKYEDQIHLARRALINFAHVGRWSEAVEMLEVQPALHSALTNRFQLYLRVCDDADRGQTEAANQRLKKSVERTEKFMTESVDGEQVEKKRTVYPSDELDALFTYPNSRDLPKEPWQGRIRAAIQRLKENRRSPRSQLEIQFRHALRDAAIQEIEAIARDASELEAIQGLMMFERAMNSNQFNLNQISALRGSQQAIFSEHQESIRIGERRKLRHLQLKPLVLVDTNLLIDAAKERIGQLLGDDGSINTQNNGSFHRTILAKAKNHQIHLFIPSAAMREFENRMNELDRVRTLFNDVWIDEVTWIETVTVESVKEIYNQIVIDYGEWQPPSNEGFNAAVSQYKQQVEDFLIEHHEIYQKVTEMKSGMSKKALAKRTKIKGNTDGQIYPERGDCDIMRTAAKLADETYRGIGSVLVATRDSDFRLVRRSLEDAFGFGVVRSARELSQWL